MCCQLVYLEPASSGKTFHRKGHGGDAGVECYRRRADGTEVGWQAKYLFHWNDGLKAQLDNSIRTALDKHPHLVEYVVCLPFNLSDSRTGKGKTARTKWDTWCTKWEEFTATQQRHLTITLWGKSELSARLAREDPAYSGRFPIGSGPKLSRQLGSTRSLNGKGVSGQPIHSRDKRRTPNSTGLCRLRPPS